MAFLAKSKDQVVEALSQATSAVSLGSSGELRRVFRNRRTRRESGMGGAALNCYVYLAEESSKSFCVDEASGDDAKGDGSPNAPYKTIAGALMAQGETITVLVRQNKEGQEGSWEPASASALKKGKKLLAQQQAKAARLEELRKKNESEGADKKAAELKKLEDAKSIVLEEPATTATKIKIRQTVENRGKRVRVFGWVHRLRQQGAMIFVVLRDGTGFLQCVLTGKLVSPEALELD